MKTNVSLTIIQLQSIVSIISILSVISAVYNTNEIYIPVSAAIQLKSCRSPFLSQVRFLVRQPF